MRLLYAIFLLTEIMHSVLSIPFVPLFSSMQPFYKTTSVYTNVSRIVVIADVHDDMRRFRNILENAKIINNNNEWIAQKNTVVVQLGDQIDRKHIDDDDIPKKHHFRITYFTDFLKKIALENGSDFISMIGNHEHMNLQKIKNKPELKDIINKRPIIAVINNFLFCHGGFTIEHYDILKRYDKNIADLNNIWDKYINDYPLDYQEKIILEYLITNNQNSILYIRKLGDKYDNNKLFSFLNIDYMFVGHSETKNIFVENKVWYLDQILRIAFDDNMYNYIDIRGNNITITPLIDYEL